MKTKIKLTYRKPVSWVAAMSFMATPLLALPPVPPPPPVVVVQTPAPVAPAPAPVVTVTAGVPEYYVWDGDEYVGFVGDQYYYLGPGNLWVPMNGERLVRFQYWERHHHNWGAHAIRNERYWRDAHGHDYSHEGREHHHGH